MSIDPRAVSVLAHLSLVACAKEPSNGATSSEGATPTAATAVTSAPIEPVSKPVAEPPSVIERLATTESFTEALEMVRPEMTDTRDEISPGAMLMSLWGASHMRWEDVGVAKNETSFALVQKDSDAARGKRMCTKGTIIQIAKEDLGESKVFEGLMLTNYSDITRFVAVGSTGNLVGRSRARFCGVVIGTYDYENSGGGVGHAIALVGMFDLKENRTSSAQ